MSDHWEFYPCQMGEQQAFIFYDHGIRDEIDGLAHPNALKIRVAFHNPTEAGLPTNEEFEGLSALEDMLGTAIHAAGDLYVGRVTVGGARYFHSFVSLDAGAAERLLEEASQGSGYELGFQLQPDPAKKAYWDDLFPTADDWRVILDMKVLDRLEEHGDDPSVARRVDHWCYFPQRSQRDSFATWAANYGFEIQHVIEPDEEYQDYGIQIFRECRTEMRAITATTHLLQHKTEEFGGSYDGWETSVETVNEITPGGSRA